MQIPIINPYMLPNIHIIIEDEEMPYDSFKKLLKGIHYLRIFLFHNSEDNKIHFHNTNNNKNNLLEKNKYLLKQHNLYNQVLVEISDFWHTYFLSIDNEKFTNNSNHKLLNIILTLKLSQEIKITLQKFKIYKHLTFKTDQIMKEKMSQDFYIKLLKIFETEEQKTLNNTYIGYSNLKFNTTNENKDEIKFIQIFFKYEKTINGIQNIIISNINQ